MNKFPPWIKKKLVCSEAVSRVESLIEELKLNTVCRSACCPNKNECFSQKKATFMILGDVCTRGCKFCAVKKGEPSQPDSTEPKRLTQAINTLGLDHAIITSVTRDDLKDGGAGHFSDVANQISKDCPKVTIEVLTPDFKGSEESLDKVLDSPINIFSHNLETAPRFYNTVRPQADYKRSLDVLKKAKRKISAIKSGIMVGFGETSNEVFCVMSDLRDVGCESLTIGQYLRPSKKQLDVHEFVHPDTFDLYKEKALSLGFKHISSGPFVRSSYMTEN